MIRLAGWVAILIGCVLVWAVFIRALIAVVT